MNLPIQRDTTTELDEATPRAQTEDQAEPSVPAALVRLGLAALCWAVFAAYCAAAWRSQLAEFLVGTSFWTLAALVFRAFRRQHRIRRYGA